jgi:peptidoglycan hydrolase-like protein with peptidoglycan-binding domain
VNWSRTAAVILGAAALVAAPFLSVRLAAAALLQSKATPQKPAPSGSVAKKTTPAKSTGSKKKVTRRRRARGQQAPNADRIKEIQQALAREGHYEGTPSGKIDPATTAALKSFQQATSLNPTGKLDALTLQKLGLGSEVAGLAPPRATPADGGATPARP